MDDPQCQVCAGCNCPPLIEHEGWTYYQCINCKLVFLAPMLTRTQLADLYANPDSGGTRAYFRKETSKLRRARGRARYLARTIEGQPAGRTFLDVGCSGGFMTQAALEVGFVPTGIDPDVDAVTHARKNYPGPTYAVGGLTEFAAQCEQEYDAVYCSEVLEHVPDANEFMAALAKLMAPSAVLYLTTPDISHWRRPKDLTQWDVFTPPHHCLFFSPNNLRKLFACHGLTIRRRQWAFKPGLKVLAEKFDGSK